MIRKVTEKKPPNILKNIHPIVRTFIELCIVIDPKKRPSAIELLQHPFLSNMDDLRNKQAASDFLLKDGHRIRRMKKAMNNNEPQLPTHLSTIPDDEPADDGSSSNSPTLHNRDVLHSQNPNTTTQNPTTTHQSSKPRPKKKYVSGTTVSVEDGGKIMVKLKIHHGPCCLLHFCHFSLCPLRVQGCRPLAFDSFGCCYFVCF